METVWDSKIFKPKKCPIMFDSLENLYFKFTWENFNIFLQFET